MENTTYLCRLRLVMRQNGVTFEELSSKTGLSVKTLQRYSMCKSTPNIGNIIKICTALSVSFENLWKWE